MHFIFVGGTRPRVPLDQNEYLSFRQTRASTGHVNFMYGQESFPARFYLITVRLSGKIPDSTRDVILLSYSTTFLGIKKLKI